jgi:hypothetical protein
MKTQEKFFEVVECRGCGIEYVEGVFCTLNEAVKWLTEEFQVSTIDEGRLFVAVDEDSRNGNGEPWTYEIRESTGYKLCTGHIELI